MTFFSTRVRRFGTMVKFWQVCSSDRAHSRFDVGSRDMHVVTRASLQVKAVRYLSGVIQERRAARSPAARASAARGLCQVFLELPWARQAQTVAVYESGSAQPGTGILRDVLTDRGVNVVSLWAAPWADADVFVVPALAVDTEGHRLVDPSDEYEELLDRLPPTVPALAAVFDDEIYDVALGGLPGPRAERPLAGVLTPTRLLPFTDDYR